MVTPVCNIRRFAALSGFAGLLTGCAAHPPPPPAPPAITSADLHAAEHSAYIRGFIDGRHYERRHDENVEEAKKKKTVKEAAASPPAGSADCPPAKAQPDPAPAPKPKPAQPHAPANFVPAAPAKLLSK